jgi:spermidine synthase
LLKLLNQDSLNSARVKVVNADAARWLETSVEMFDFVVADFPDPTSYALGKLYSTGFYRLLEKHLAPRGLLVVQATSPFYARHSFWAVVATLEHTGFQVAPYHALVPSFGEWGFILAGRAPYVPPAQYGVATRFLTPEITATLFRFPADMERVEAEPNRLNDQSLVRTFEAEWRRVQR